MGKAYLILETGEVFTGEGFGAADCCTGELVFNTGVVGYLESLTDPAYRGQILMFTFPMVGNYGIIPEDFETDTCHVQGIVLRECCEFPSNFRCGGTLDTYLKEQGIPGIAGVDTRQLTQLVREHGVMNAMICTEIPADAKQTLAEHKLGSAVAGVSTQDVYRLEPEEEPCANVAVVDYGVSQSVLQALLERGCSVTVFPYDTTAEILLAAEPDGILLSGGPGNPAEEASCVAELRKLLGKKPIFAMGLGHQLLALAAGGKTEKLKYGHRGSNQPVRDLATGRISITAQNHGYIVAQDDLNKMGAVLTHVNVNDGSCEGLSYPALQAFSLQFQPQSNTDLRDGTSAYDTFMEMMGVNANA